MKSKFLSLSFRAKILFTFTTGTLFALILQTILFYYSSSYFMYTQANEYNLNSLNNMQDDLYTFITSMEKSMLEVYLNNSFMTDLATINDPLILQKSYKKLAYSLALSEFIPSQNVNAIYIYNLDHVLISSYRHAATPKYTYPKDIHTSPSSTNAQVVIDYVNSDNKIMLITSYYNTNRKTNLIRFVIKLYKDNASQKIGYMICDVDTKAFNKIINKHKYSHDQFIWLQPLGDTPVTQMGNLQDAELPYFETISNFALSNDTVSIDNAIHRHNNTFLEIPQKRYNLTAFSLTPHSLLKQNYYALASTLIFTALLIIIIFLILFIFISRILTRSLATLIDSMEQIRTGNTSLRIACLGDQEFDKLGDSFNNMLDRIEDLIHNEYQAKILLNHTKYKALQAQINPHFLYNTLDTMSGIATSQNCLQVSSLCRALSQIFRYSLSMKDALATIEEELIHLRNYLYIINIRTQNSIKINIDVDSSLLKECIPKLSIQPLVENSISHGFKNKHGDKKIFIKVDSLDNLLIICVTDNGLGMDAALINAHLASSEKDVLEKNSSIGLDNINARIKLLFGSEYGVTVESTLGEGSSTLLSLPRIKRE